MNLLKTACVVSVLSLALSACGDKAEKKVETDAAQETTQTMSTDAAAPAPAAEEAAPAAQESTDAQAQQPADAPATAETKSE